MATMAFDLGDLPRLLVTFKNLSGDPTDPTTVTFVMKEPDGTQTTYVYVTDAALVKDSVGNYHVDWTITKAGRHLSSFIGTGAVESSENTEFYGRRREATGGAAA